MTDQTAAGPSVPQTILAGTLPVHQLGTGTDHPEIVQSVDRRDGTLMRGLKDRRGHPHPEIMQMEDIGFELIQYLARVCLERFGPGAVLQCRQPVAKPQIPDLSVAPFPDEYLVTMRAQEFFLGQYHIFLTSGGNIRVIIECDQDFHAVC